jgi:hypothetical protein
VAWYSMAWHGIQGRFVTERYHFATQFSSCWFQMPSAGMFT